jgi:hypothetical protein
MKTRLFVLLTSVLFTSCVNLKFDNLEYDKYVTIKKLVDLNKFKCVDYNRILPIISNVRDILSHQIIYSKYRIERPQIYESTVSLKLIVDKIYFRNSFSQEYCLEKMDNISQATTMILSALGEQL